MAKQHKRKAAKGRPQAAKPITSHQLFPAVVALWFGALFGLGSLAIRPTLLESLVMKIRIDLIVPAAAPPLGITARMLIALAMAAIGATIGVLIARRIARPKQEVRQRKRGARSQDSAADLSDHRADYAGYAAPNPVSVHDEIDFGEEAGGLLAGRRRAALAIEHEEAEFVPHEMAPLPGGAPQVLDISGIELTSHAPITSDEELPAPDLPRHLPHAASAPEAPLDLGVFAQAGSPPAAAPFAPPTPPPLDFSAAPFSAPAGQSVPERQVFQPAPVNPALLDVTATPAQPPRQIFGMPVEDDHVDQSFLRAAGFKTSVFDTEQPEPLFTAREAAAPTPLDLAEPEPFAPFANNAAPAEEEPAPLAVPAFAPMPASFAAATDAPFAGPADPMPAAEAPVSAAPAECAPIASAPASLPPVAGLGMTDLASRLQQSMQRRRAARSGSAAPLECAPTAGTEAQDAPLAAPAVMPSMSASDAPPADPAPIPAAFVDSAGLLSPAPAFAAPDAAVVVPPAPLAMPAALRPLDLGDPVLDDGDDMLASLLPPRNIAMPVAPIATPAAKAAAQPAAFAAPPAAAPVHQPLPDAFQALQAAFAPVAEAEAEAVVEPTGADSEVDSASNAAEEEGYASLLDIGQPLAARSQFVRIEEPEADSAEVEPVVIFPGQAQFGAPAAAPAPFAAPHAEAMPFRKFDAPSTAGQGGTIAAASSMPVTDPSEADQALRAALANLQRMSGAA